MTLNFFVRLVRNLFTDEHKQRHLSWLVWLLLTISLPKAILNKFEMYCPKCSSRLWKNFLDIFEDVEKRLLFNCVNPIRTFRVLGFVACFNFMKICQYAKQKCIYQEWRMKVTVSETVFKTCAKFPSYCVSNYLYFHLII